MRHCKRPEARALIPAPMRALGVCCTLLLSGRQQEQGLHPPPRQRVNNYGHEDRKHRDVGVTHVKLTTRKKKHRPQQLNRNILCHIDSRQGCHRKVSISDRQIQPPGARGVRPCSKRKNACAPKGGRRVALVFLSSVSQCRVICPFYFVSPLPCMSVRILPTI